MQIASQINGRVRIANPNFSGNVYDYEELAASYSGTTSLHYPLIKTVCPSWDNEARKPGAGHSFHGANPASYARWLRSALAITQAAKPNEGSQPPFVFVNAWNEWAEDAPGAGSPIRLRLFACDCWRPARFYRTRPQADRFGRNFAEEFCEAIRYRHSPALAL